MDFMNLIKGIEALLYECLSWLIFYPLTLWRVVRRPAMMLRSAETELAKTEHRFDDSMSPPIFLVVTLLLSLLAQRGLGADTSPLIAGAFADTQNLLMFRAVALGLFPLLFALQTIRLRGLPLTRQSMQPAFYGQCFIAGPFVLAMGLAQILAVQGETAGWAALGLTLLTLGWYAAIQARWLHLVGAGWGRAVATAILTIIGTFVLLGIFSWLVSAALGAMAA